VWTTDIFGVTQDANGYDKRCDVYVNASGIPLATVDDDLYVQVTDTSGGIVLSHDPLIFIVPNSSITVTLDKKGNPFGAFTKQGPICPYAESTNGIYKVYVSADDSFPTSNSFTDNFSVRLGDPGISKMCYTLVPGSIQQLAYTITVTNFGGETLGVAVEDVLPSVLTNAKYRLDGTLKGDWPTSNTVSLGLVEADAVHTIEIYVDVPAGLATIGPNTAKVSSTSIDDNIGNNSSTCTNGIAGVTAINVTKTVDPTSVSEPGGSVTFTVVIENTGTVALTLLDSVSTLDDSIYGDVANSGNTLITSTTAVLPQTIIAGSFYEFSFSATVSGDAGDTETDTITATAEDAAGKVVSAEDSATVTITNIPSSISVTKTANPTFMSEPGGTVTFTVIVENTSTVDSVTIDSLIDDQFGDISDNCVPALPATLAPGETITCSFSKNVSGNAGETHTNVATATGTDDDGYPLEESDTATVTFTDVLPTITVQKTANPTSVPETGGAVTFTVKVTNTSLEPVTLTNLVDDIHGNLNGQGTLVVPQTIPAGDFYQGTFTVTLSGDAGDSETDIVSATVQDNDGNSVTETDDATVTFTDVLPSITVQKTANPTSVTEPGGMVTFTVRVTNDSAEILTLFSLVDDIHGDLNGQGTLSVPQNIPVGGFYEGTFTATVLGNSGDTETDTVTAKARDDELNETTETDTADVVIVGARMTFGPDGAINAIGDEHTFTAHLEINDGTGWQDAGDETISIVKTSGPGTLSTGPYVTDSSTGLVSVTLNSDTPGVTIVTASWNGTVLSTSVSASDPADKTWVEIGARMTLTPDGATNKVTDPHILTAHLEIYDGTSWQNADGETIAISITSGPGALSAGPYVTDTNGLVDVTLNSAVSGVIIVTASWNGTILSSPVSASDTADKTYVDGYVTITPGEAVNAVGDEHTFTITAYAQGAIPTSWNLVLHDVTPTPSSETLTGPAIAGDGMSASWQLTINNLDPGVFTASASVDITFGTTVVSVSADGTGNNSAPADKTYVDARMDFGPDGATNAIGDEHTFTVHLEINDGTGWQDADGETVIVDIISGPGTLGGGPYVTDANGLVDVTLNSDVAGVTNVTASWNGTILGTSANASDPSDKTWVDARMTFGPDGAINAIGDEHTFTDRTGFV
jgi:uncharacterized repeat protein (TIGR01451 family)